MAGVGTAIGRILAPIVVGALLLGVWLLLVDVVEVSPTLIPSPWTIGSEFVANLGIIAEDAVTTGTNALLGLLIGSVVAILLAALAARLAPVDGMLAPIVAALMVVPIVALTPIFNTMFGASAQTGRILIAAIAAFVPVFINMLRGLRQAQPVQRDLFAAYAARGGQTFTRLTLPAALPHLLTGVRIAGSLAVIAAVVAEYFGGPADGVGTAIATYAKSGRIPLAWAYVGAAIAIGIVLFLVSILLERIVRRYRTET